MENEKCTLQDLEFGEKPDQQGKLETHMVEPGIWRETLKNVQNEKNTLQDLEYGKKTKKKRKMRNSQGLTWNMARNNEKCAK